MDMLENMSMAKVSIIALWSYFLFKISIFPFYIESQPTHSFPVSLWCLSSWHPKEKGSLELMVIKKLLLTINLQESLASYTVGWKLALGMVYFRHLRLSSGLGWAVRNSDKAKRDTKGMARYLTTPRSSTPLVLPRSNSLSLRRVEIRLSWVSGE